MNSIQTSGLPTCSLKRYGEVRDRIKNAHWTNIACTISMLFLLVGIGVVLTSSEVANQKNRNILHFSGLVISYASFFSIVGLFVACLFRNDPPQNREDRDRYIQKV